MKKIAEKVDDLLDELQELMESGSHISDPSKVEEVLDRLSLYWAHLGDENVDYIQASRIALEEKIEWKL